MLRWLAIILGVAGLASIASGLAVIGQDEVGVVRRFGAVLREPWGAGIALGDFPGGSTGSTGSKWAGLGP